jgi:adenosylcobinamide-GDP ribazoletransferase
VKNIYLGLKFAFSYFSILPIKFNKNDDLSNKKVLAFMLYFFPLVGLVISLLSVGLYQILAHLAWLGAVISAVFYVMLYGFLHNEAVMDVADGIYAKHGGKDAYQIIKEPTVGALGVYWGVSFFILKFSLIVYIFKLGAFWEFVFVAIVSRFALMVMIKTFNAKSTFLTTLKNALDVKYIVIIGFIVLIFTKVWIFVLGLFVTFLSAKFIEKKLGFINGDVMGTSLEVTEIVLLFSVVLLWV